MDAHLFRRFCDDFVPALTGVRIEKIYQLTTGVSVFSLYGLGKYYGDKSLFGDKKQFLVLKEGRDPLLFLSEHRPSTGAHPPAFIMRLRKHCAGKRIERAFANWIERKLYLQVQGDVWICLDLRKGVLLFFGVPEEIIDFFGGDNLPQAPINPLCAQDAENLGFPKGIIPLGGEFERQSLSSNQDFLKSKMRELSISAFPEWNTVYDVCVRQAGSDRAEEQEKGESVLDSQSAMLAQAIWRQYPVITPLLRNTLPFLDEMEGMSLYADLQLGGGDIVVYILEIKDKIQNNTSQRKKFPQINESVKQDEKVKQDEEENQGAVAYSQLGAAKDCSAPRVEISPWLLPDGLLAKMGLLTSYAKAKELVFENCIAALSYVGSFVLTRLSQDIKTKLAKPMFNEVKRLDKLSLKLDKEEERLLNMVARKEDALLLQARLYDLDPKAKEKNIQLLDFNGNLHTILLDPSKSIGENMEYFFHVAGRGKRGLEHLKIRLENLALQKQQILQDALEESALQKGFEGQKKASSKKQTQQVVSQNTKNSFNKGNQFSYKNQDIENQGVHKQEEARKSGKYSMPLTSSQKLKSKNKFPPQVQAFRSSDGFLILRGRDTKGNGLVLKMANPHDFWVHIAEGASAHVIIRRDHPQQEVPQRTLEEAGILALLKSWQKEQDKGLVQFSMAKYIRPMKAGKGLVHVDRSEGTFLVQSDTLLEEKLGCVSYTEA